MSVMRTIKPSFNRPAPATQAMQAAPPPPPAQPPEKTSHPKKSVTRKNQVSRNHSRPAVPVARPPPPVVPADPELRKISRPGKIQKQPAQKKRRNSASKKPQPPLTLPLPGKSAAAGAAPQFNTAPAGGPPLRCHTPIPPRGDRLAARGQAGGDPQSRRRRRCSSV